VRILIISLRYPPIDHVAGLRAESFAQALVGLGHSVMVVTGHLVGDSTALGLADIDGVEVLRVAAAPHFGGLGSFGTVGRRLRTAVGAIHGGAYGRWVSNVFTALDAIQLRLSPSVIWAILGTDTTHELGRQLALRYRCPWVADFKDPWDTGRQGLGRTLAKVAEQRRLRSAAAVTAASSRNALHLSDLFCRHVVPVYSGVDLRLWSSVEPIELGPYFNLVFTGHVTHSIMAVEELGEGLAIASRGGLDPSRVRFHYFGSTPQVFEALLDKFNLGNIFVPHGYVSRVDVAGAQRAATLLIHLPRKDPAVCVKFLEYVASSRPILSIPEEPDSYVRDAAATGQVLSADSAAGVAETIRQLYEDWLMSGPPSSAEPTDALTGFSWVEQCVALQRVFSDVTLN
jgi:glycosyltransferase involved in cell wall biosynthesis